MAEYEALIQTIALTLGIAWASGINLYAAVAMLGLGGATGTIDLPPGLAVVQDPIVILAAGFMYCVEFVVDKTPGADTAWDGLHTFIRIPAGAVLAAGAAGSVDPALSVAAGLLGGTITAATHTAKAGSRAMINTSPEPFSNWGASLAEDIAVFAGLWAALAHPVIFLLAFAAFILLLCWLLPKIARGICAVVQRIGRWLGLTTPPPARRLFELERLYQQGLLTEPEYLTVKARIDA